MEPTSEQSLFDTNMDQVSQEHLQTVVKWTRFISITGFVGLGLMLLAFAIAGSQLPGQFMRAFSMNFGAIAGVVVVIFLLFIGLMVAWVYFLYKSSTQLNEGLRNRDSAQLADGFTSMKLYFIISFVISALSIFFTLSTMF